MSTWISPPGSRVLVADHLFRLRPGHKAGSAVAAQDRMHRGGCDPDRPADHVRPLLQLAPAPAGSPPRPLPASTWVSNHGRLERSASDSPLRPRLTHFDAVWREQPTTSAAALIVTPAATRSHSR